MKQIIIVQEPVNTIIIDKVKKRDIIIVKRKSSDDVYGFVCINKDDEYFLVNMEGQLSSLKYLTLEHLIQTVKRFNFFML